MQEVYFHSISQGYFKYTWNILQTQVYFKYTWTCWITEKDVYFKSILIRQKKYIWSKFCEILLVFLM